MIKTAQQLKALVRNRSKGDSAKAQEIMTIYALERFLERLSLSPYRESFILKGGALIASLVGVDNRSTRDVDATLKNLPLTKEDVQGLVKEVALVPLDDGIEFAITSVTTIMDDQEYPGIRVFLDAKLERIRIPIKIDFSTDDVITPSEVEYSMKLLFEDREISILTYNIETILAEKLQTILSRGTASTRMRDYYDVYALTTIYCDSIDFETVKSAFDNTCKKRNTVIARDSIELILSEIEVSTPVVNLWNSYSRKFDYAANIDWGAIMSAVQTILEKASLL